MPCISPKPGFTLAELLIALALLGIIAAFTIPKVLQSSAENERVALLRETVATLEEAWFNARATNSVVAGTLYDNLTGRVNTVSESSGIVMDPGGVMESMPSHVCLIPSLGDFEDTYYGHLQFANGVMVINVSAMDYGARMFTPQVVENTPLCIDINGLAGPNRNGQDVFWGNFNPWGDFDMGVGAVYTFGDNRKAFHWGNQSESFYDPAGFQVVGAPYGSPEARVGYWLTR